MTTATLLDTLVGDDGYPFTATQKSNAITLCQTYWNVSDGDSDQKDMGIAMMAQLVLRNLRKPPEEQIALEEMVTDEIRQLMTDPDDPRSNESVFVIDTDQPTETWY